MMKRILVADDDAAARKMLARVLESCGYVPVQASSEHEAIASFCDARPVLVILDLKGETREGWKTYEELRKLDPMVPLIGITAWSNRFADAMRRGVDALMEKPLDMQALLEMIEHLTTEQELKQQHLADSTVNAPPASQKT
jgi:DNA-binding NtrC family response regulator